jgi:two-component system, cell cycle response regulator
VKDTTPILIAEDHPSTRLLLQRILAKAGYEVTCAGNGKEALEKFAGSFYPIVLIDWIMPEMDGLELCAALRKQSGQGYVYIIFVTARESKIDVVHALEKGADDYVTKPFDRKELLARIQTGLRVLTLEQSLKQANEEIRALSFTDPLTGLYNRGYLNEHLPREINRSLRYGHPLHIIMCDIDRFKVVNDTYGHQAGDEVLKSFAELMTSSVRQKVDWVARYGGEEFVMVLPETDALGAETVSERLRDAIEKKRFDARGKSIRITASFGVSGFRPDPSHRSLSPDTLLMEADHSLLQAKQAGRNHVKIYTPGL